MHAKDLCTQNWQFPSPVSHLSVPAPTPFLSLPGWASHLWSYRLQMVWLKKPCYRKELLWVPVCNSLAFPSFSFSFPSCSPLALFQISSTRQQTPGFCAWETWCHSCLWCNGATLGNRLAVCPKGFSVPELHAHNHWCLYSKHNPYQSAMVWNITLLGEKKWRSHGR